MDHLKNRELGWSDHEVDVLLTAVDDLQTSVFDHDDPLRRDWIDTMVDWLLSHGNDETRATAKRRLLELSMEVNRAYEATQP
jgi:hypothetical protein